MHSLLSTFGFPTYRVEVFLGDQRTLISRGPRLSYYESLLWHMNLIPFLGVHFLFKVFLKCIGTLPFRVVGTKLWALRSKGWCLGLWDEGFGSLGLA